jgi:dTDP-3-amino-3,4,6-trideoxy-alpha-D-glucose transaminase
MNESSPTAPVPSIDLSRVERRIADELTGRWDRIRESTAFIGGDEASTFERDFARFLGAAGVVGMANGTDALEISLRCLDLRPGDEVIVPALTFIATAGAVVFAGGRPVFADIDEATLNLDPAALEPRITERTVGVIGVHLYGRPFDVDAVLEVCDRHGLWLLEDAAQAHGARWKDRRVGTFGRLATWSFYPTKNLGAFGDAGAVSGTDSELLERVRRVANHGRETHTLHTEVGTNSRMDGLQAAVLNCRLRLLDQDNQRRRELAARYRDGLTGVGDLRFLEDREGAEPVYHQLTVLTSRRDALREHLAAQGIGSGIYYPLPLHRQPAFAHLIAADESYPVAERATEHSVSLPMFPELTFTEAQRVIDAVREFFEG